MPETAALAAWNILHLGGNAFDTAAVEFIPGCIVQGIQQNAGLDIVKVSALVLFNFSALVKNGVNPACGIVQVLLFPGQLPGFQHPGKKNALVIIEMAFRRQVGSSKLAHHCIAGGAGTKQCFFHFLSFLMYVQLLRISDIFEIVCQCHDSRSSVTASNSIPL